MSPGRFLREGRRLQGVLVLALVLFAAVVGYSFWRQNTTLIALCAQRKDLDQRIASTKSLLDHHRGQSFIFRIPRALIVSGYHRDLKTRHNLDILDCKESP